MSEASLETKRYLDQIGSRIKSYHISMDRAKKFVLEKNINKRDIIISCIIMSLLWTASVREEILTEDDLLMFLNIDTDLSTNTIFGLHPMMKDWSLDEALTYVLKNY